MAAQALALPIRKQGLSRRQWRALAPGGAKYEDEFMFNINGRLLLWGFGLWLAGTIALRVGGQHLLRPGHWTETFLLFALSFPVLAWVVRQQCRAARLPEEQWPAGAVSVVLPTVLLDPFSCVFFSRVFPNIPPEAAGLFGGWMLWCCAGALLGTALRG